MKKPLAGKLIVKKRLVQAADYWEIHRMLQEKNIHILCLSQPRMLQ